MRIEHTNTTHGIRATDTVIQSAKPFSPNGRRWGGSHLCQPSPRRKGRAAAQVKQTTEARPVSNTKTLLPLIGVSVLGDEEACLLASRLAHLGINNRAAWIASMAC
jgi:hypothetical protein